MAEVQWYYARNDQQFGPVSASELKQLADAGGITPDDLLWREGMDAWTTAINLRGLFGEDPPLDILTPAGLPTTSDLAPRPPRSRASVAPSLHTVVRATQAILWGICVMIVLIGAVLFTRAFLAANGAAEEAAAGAVFSTFFIGAYVLARAGEKLSRLLVSMSRRRMQ
jgi:hypothetical protein